MGRRRVVFVADDLGISVGVNEGIAAAARAGLVREASLCVTGGAVEQGVRVANELGIGIGLHLSFTLGRALTGPIRGLTDADGNFGGLGRALLRCQLRIVDGAAVAREVEAQLVRLADLGVRPTHANGHHHSHCWPVLREVCAEAFARHGIAWTRLPAEAKSIGGAFRPLPFVLGRLSSASRSFFHRAGLRTLPFVGASMEACMDHESRFMRALRCLPEGDCEWMVHPRLPDADFARIDPLGATREDSARAELATLTGVAARAALDELGIDCVGYAELA